MLYYGFNVKHIYTENICKDQCPAICLRENILYLKYVKNAVKWNFLLFTLSFPQIGMF